MCPPVLERAGKTPGADSETLLILTDLRGWRQLNAPQSLPVEALIYSWFVIASPEMNSGQAPRSNPVLVGKSASYEIAASQKRSSQRQKMN